ncbi:MAG: hypothetical protein ACI9UA_003120, partial [Pseudoalteromonas tetraodonis]
KARAAYIADGGSFDRTSGFAKPVPDDENFGAIPLLNGITAETPAGDLVRDKLAEIGLNKSGHSWPRPDKDKRKPKRKHGHELRQKRDLALFESFFIDIGLLTSASDPAQLEAKLFDAYESAHGTSFAELHAGSSRPSAVLLPLAVDRYDPQRLMWSLSNKELRGAQNLAKGLMLHAHLALRTDRSDVALADVRSMNQLAVAVQADGSNLIAHLVGIAINSMLLEPTWEGIADHRWTEAQLRELQSLFLARDIAEEMREALRGEIIFMDEMYSNIGEALAATSSTDALAPLIKPWADHNQAQVLEFYHKDLLQASQAPDGYIQAKKNAETTTATLEAKAPYNPRYALARMTIPSMSAFTNKSARTHAELQMAAAACALERYYLTNQDYPDKLESLVPDFAEKVATDPVNGKPLHYQKTIDGRYQLYSIGADGADNLGHTGDITWGYATAP